MQFHTPNHSIPPLDSLLSIPCVLKGFKERRGLHHGAVWAGGVSRLSGKVPQLLETETVLHWSGT